MLCYLVSAMAVITAAAAVLLMTCGLVPTRLVICSLVPARLMICGLVSDVAVAFKPVITAAVAVLLMIRGILDHRLGGRRLQEHVGGRWR